MKIILAIFVVMASVVSFALSADPRNVPLEEIADIVLVKKAERKLHLLKDWEIIRTYNISLGQNPVGHKQKEGDSRTPEGFYYIDGRNPNSQFFRSLHISFPNEIDRYLARISGHNPGGDIAIHGEPVGLNSGDRLKQDWTQGCIGLTDRDMLEVWYSVKDGTPVLIEP